MHIAGIIAEYNPFHTGHTYHIAQTRRALGENTAIVCAMSGNFVQRGDCAVTDKWRRAALTLEGGADLVLEIPTVWAVSSAESFARGGLEVLAATGVVDTLSFGSESGDLGALRRAADALDGESCRAALREGLDAGLSFPSARAAAVRSVLGADASCLDDPNDNLGVEYLRAAKAAGWQGEFLCIPRLGAPHDGGCAGEYASASYLRECLRRGESGACAPYLCEGGRSLAPEEIADLTRIDRAVLARVRTMTAEDWCALPDSGEAEGLPVRLVRAAGEAVSASQVCELAKTKRYPLARLRRLVLWACLGLTQSDRPAHVPYLRVLGMTPRGQEILREMKEKATLPVITKPTRVRELGGEALALFERESRSTDLYGLCFSTPRACGAEWSTSPVIRGSGAPDPEDTL